ncbi:echinoidin-like [Haliotis rufescens]|uniref:echinoidin-like n=1 Tax=Haliotis rufescens TaxID=6454 RepID=UPI001EB0288A|nr:echinoidin-like [Haliotis rufescens]
MAATRLSLLYRMTWCAVLVATASALCPNGFVRHDDSCYKVFLIPTTWPEAIIFCEAFGAKLAEISTASEQQFLESYLAPLKSSVNTMDVWIGGSDLIVEGNFMWSWSGDPIVYSHWVPGEPNSLGDEDCMALFTSRNFMWNDAPCETNQMFLCEIPGSAYQGSAIIG